MISPVPADLFDDRAINGGSVRRDMKIDANIARQKGRLNSPPFASAGLKRLDHRELRYNKFQVLVQPEKISLARCGKETF